MDSLAHNHGVIDPREGRVTSGGIGRDGARKASKDGRTPRTSPAGEKRNGVIANSMTEALFRDNHSGVFISG